TVANIGPQAPMYDCLIRRDPRDGQSIIPDLAWKWDISPDGKKYTFYLRKGVKFHDGADFSAEDVKATYERIVRPPKGVVIPRSSLFTTVGDIVVLDPYRIEFRLTEARPKASCSARSRAAGTSSCGRRPSRRTRAISARS